jgi:hypothetical protein
MKKKVETEEIQKLKSCLYYKIFDLLKHNGTRYYLDKEFNLIWDENKDVVGIIDQNKYLFFDDITIIVNSIEKEKIF